MKTLTLKTKSSAEEYRIVCGEGAFGKLHVRGKAFVFTDENVYALYGRQIAECLQGVPVYAMKAGEEHKNYLTLFALLEKMADAGLHRNDTLVCIGGGVVGDVGGLASALYMRGIDCVQVPTTLLAQVDSSVGGKTAVDFAGVKNLVGAFKQPVQVLVDPVFLKTLSAREIRCGLGEMVKHAALDCALFDNMKSRADKLFDLDFLAELVPDNIAVKARFVEEDTQEKGARKFLNLGHTTGHAFELSDGRLSHGEYVLIGLLYEAEIAKKYLSCDIAYLDELKELALSLLGGMTQMPDAEAAALLARLDKKNETAERISLAVPVAKGKFQLLELSVDAYLQELVAIGEGLC